MILNKDIDCIVERAFSRNSEIHRFSFQSVDFNLPLIDEYRKFMSNSKFKQEVTLLTIMHSYRTGNMISTDDVMSAIFERLLSYNTQKKLKNLIWN